MIRKFLVCGKQQLFLQNQLREGFGEIGRVIELIMPIREYWTLEGKVKEVNYLLSSGDSSPEVSSHYKSAVKFSISYALREEDRAWMINYAKEKK